MRSRSGGELPQLELECLSTLWGLEQAPVADVHAGLAARGRRLAYTTVLTVLERLLRKNVVMREKRGRAYIYRPLISKEVMRERAIRRVVDLYFDSRAELQAYVNGAANGDGRGARSLSAPAANTAPAVTGDGEVGTGSTPEAAMPQAGEAAETIARPAPAAEPTPVRPEVGPESPFLLD